MESWFLKVFKVPEAGWGPQGGLALPSYPSTPQLSVLFLPWCSWFFS